MTYEARSNPSEYQIYTRTPSGREEIISSDSTFDSAAQRMCDIVLNERYIYEVGIYGKIDDLEAFDPHQRYIASKMMRTPLRTVLMVRHKYGEFTGNDPEAVNKIIEMCSQLQSQPTSNPAQAVIKGLKVAADYDLDKYINMPRDKAISAIDKKYANDPRKRAKVIRALNMVQKGTAKIQDKGWDVLRKVDIPKKEPKQNAVKRHVAERDGWWTAYDWEIIENEEERQYEEKYHGGRRRDIHASAYDKAADINLAVHVRMPENQFGERVFVEFWPQRYGRHDGQSRASNVNTIQRNWLKSKGAYIFDDGAGNWALKDSGREDVHPDTKKIGNYIRGLVGYGPSDFTSKPTRQNARKRHIAERQNWNWEDYEWEIQNWDGKLNLRGKKPGSKVQVFLNRRQMSRSPYGNDKYKIIVKCYADSDGVIDKEDAKIAERTVKEILGKSEWTVSVQRPIGYDYTHESHSATYMNPRSQTEASELWQMIYSHAKPPAWQTSDSNRRNARKRHVAERQQGKWYEELNWKIDDQQEFYGSVKQVIGMSHKGAVSVAWQNKEPIITVKVFNETQQQEADRIVKNIEKTDLWYITKTQPRGMFGRKYSATYLKPTDTLKAEELWSKIRSQTKNNFWPWEYGHKPTRRNARKKHIAIGRGWWTNLTWVPVHASHFNNPMRPCALCGIPSHPDLEFDVATGNKAFCTEQHYAEYTGIKYKGEGYYSSSDPRQYNLIAKHLGSTIVIHSPTYSKDIMVTGGITLFPHQIEKREKAETFFNQHGFTDVGESLNNGIQTAWFNLDNPDVPEELKKFATSKIPRSNLESNYRRNARKKHIVSISPYAFQSNKVDEIIRYPNGASWEGRIKIDISGIDWMPKWMKPAFLEVNVSDEFSQIESDVFGIAQDPDKSIFDSKPLFVYSIVSDKPRPKKAKEFKMSADKWKDVVMWLRGVNYPPAVLAQLDEKLDEIPKERSWRKYSKIKIRYEDINSQQRTDWNKIMQNAIRRNLGRKRRIAEVKWDIPMVDYGRQYLKRSGPINLKKKEWWDFELPLNPETDPSSILYPGKRTSHADYESGEDGYWIPNDGWQITFSAQDSTMTMQPKPSAEHPDLKLERYMRIAEAYGLSGVKWAVSDDDLTESGEIDIISGFVPPLMKDYMVSKLIKP